MTDRCTACPQRSPFPDGNGDFCRLEGAPCAAVAAACAERYRFTPSARHYPSRVHVRARYRHTPMTFYPDELSDD